MRCPVCGADTLVVDSRSTSADVRRRRKCVESSCDYRFTTHERIDVPGAQTAVQARAALAKLREAAESLVHVVETLGSEDP